MLNSGESEKALECIRKIEQRQVEEPGIVLDHRLSHDLVVIRRKRQSFSSFISMC